MAQKGGFAVSESDRRLIRENAFFVREALFTCMTEAQVECSVAFARYLNRFGLNSENYWLFLRLVMTNNPWVIDELLHEREARLLFSTIRPDAELIDAAFQTLYSRHPEELYPAALEALLGIIESAYFDPDDGYRIRRLSIMDINALGKFLLKAESQDNPQNRLILDILDRITHLGEYYGEQDKSVLSKHAFNVRFAYFDTTRELVDAIPHPLLVRVPDHGKVRPEEDYVDLVAKRRARKRDSNGRFIREVPEPEPVQDSSTETAGGSAATAIAGSLAPEAAPSEAPPPATSSKPAARVAKAEAGPASAGNASKAPSVKPSEAKPKRPAAKPSAPTAKPKGQKKPKG
jgi:hypothetical protein